MRERFLQTVLIALLWCYMSAVAAASPRNFTGTFELRQALTFYIVNTNGADFTLKLRWRDDSQLYGDRPRLTRVFDPDERLILRHEHPGERIASGPAPRYSLDLPVPARGPGVYQVVVTGFEGTLEFDTSPRLPWGVFGHPRLVGRGDMFASAYIYLPPGLPRLEVRSEGTIKSLVLTDSAGQPRLDLRGANSAGRVELPRTGEHVWKLAIEAPPAVDYRLDFGGLPIILCPDPATARAIRASVEVLHDGTICFHKFQARVHAVLERYRQMPRSAFEVALPSLAQYANHWMAEPDRNDLLLGAYGVYAALPAVLHEQNLDPRSPWFGSIHTWRQRPHENPWSDYTRLGLTRTAETSSVLAAVYSINKPFNPLHKHAGLRNRIIVAALQELMLLREYEMPDHAVPDKYFGGDRSATFSAFLRAFPLLVNDCPPDVRDVWTEGLRRYVDHESISQVALTVNQWSFILKGLQHFYDGTGDPTYRELVQRHIRWILTRNQWDRGQQPAGYFDESGPDGTYVGMTLHHLAWLYGQTRDESLREALRRCVDLFNHTVVPQPDGALIGATSFNTRTSWSWTEPQYGAGLAMLAGEIREASPLLGTIWPTNRRPPRDPAERGRLQSDLRGRLSYAPLNAFTDPSWSAARIAAGPDLHFAIWEHYAVNPLRARLPVVARRNFTRNFGDEFFCVRRPSYYAFIYAGKPTPEWQKDRRPEDANQQHQRNGGGLAMFWSPSFGVSLLGQNWSAYAAHSFIAEHAGGRGADWEDYWTVTNSFDEGRAMASVSGAIRNQPLHFRREYRFLQDRVECELTLRAPQPLALSALWESFPCPLPPLANLQISMLDETGRRIDRGPASAIMFRNLSHEAHLIIFDQPREWDLGAGRTVDHYQKQRAFGRILIALPTQWHTGQEHTWRWTIMAVPAEQAQEMVRTTIFQMRSRP